MTTESQLPLAAEQRVMDAASKRFTALVNSKRVGQKQQQAAQPHPFMRRKEDQAAHTPRIVDSLIFRNAEGQRHYEEAKNVLEPFARATFSQLLTEKISNKQQLLKGANELAHAMRSNQKLDDKHVFAFDPKTSAAHLASVEYAAQQLGAAFGQTTFEFSGLNPFQLELQKKVEQRRLVLEKINRRKSKRQNLRLL